ncbi:MAG TPA: branched-chain amino acid ABC transporter substrate-binding protein [Syntrophomonadaceae bacterium]|nr:branched-chain amino acid ABC transporter substrate-binding protein [Syntrophomonadaceae bacterium]
MLRKSSKVVVFALITIFIATALGGCGAVKTGKTGGDVIKIASVSPLSGSQSAIGEDIKLGAQMAFDEKKAELEKLGFKVEFAPQDDQADPKMGVTVAQKLIADKSFMAVVGHFNSGVAIPSSEIYNKDNLCMVSPGTTNPDVTDRKLPSVNRICARDDVQGPMGADFVMKDLSAKKVFIIHDKTTYGQGIAQEFQKRAKSIGLEVAGFEGITAGESDFSGVLNKVGSVKPDVVYFGGIYPEGSLLIRQMSEKGIKAKFMGPDGMDNAEVVKIAGNAAIGTFYSSPAADIARTPEGKDWVARFKAKFNKEPGNWSAYGYDSMTVIIEGLKSAITKNDGKMPTRKQVCEAVRATKDLQGVTSVITLDGKGDNMGAKLYISEFKQAKYPATVVKEIAAKDFK